MALLRATHPAPSPAEEAAVPAHGSRMAAGTDSTQPRSELGNAELVAPSHRGAAPAVICKPCSVSLPQTPQRLPAPNLTVSPCPKPCSVSLSQALQHVPALNPPSVSTAPQTRAVCHLPQTYSTCVPRTSPSLPLFLPGCRGLGHTGGRAQHRVIAPARPRHIFLWDYRLLCLHMAANNIRKKSNWPLDPESTEHWCPSTTCSPRQRWAPLSFSKLCNPETAAPQLAAATAIQGP